MSDEALFLGIDGGGTKTALCIIDQRGHRLAVIEGPSLYYFGQSISLVEDVLQTIVAAICADAGISPQQIAHAFVGYPAYGEASGDIAALDAIPRRVLGHDRYTCGNDMVCAWAGSLATQDGINVISGTGSLAYGERRGRSGRAGGWGEFFGDEGSGYWIAVRGLAAFSQMSDGRLEPGPLLELVRAHMDLSHDLDAIDIVSNRWKGTRSSIAALTKVVAEAAALGDESAETILARAGVELAKLADALARRLGFDAGERVPVSYSGGVFKNVSPVVSAFTDALAERATDYDVREPVLDPVTGAALYAAKQGGQPLDKPAVATLRIATPVRQLP